MPKWLPLVGGMAAFVLVIIGLVLWLIFGGVAGKQRGLVIINLRAVETIVSLDDGQSARFNPGESKTLFAIKKDFPQSLTVNEASGAPVFKQRLEYSALVEAEFRIAVDDRQVVFPAKPAE